MSINIVSRIDRNVPLRHALVSVSDKTGLERLIPGLLAVNPNLRLYSTGGTFARIQEILGPRARDVLTRVSDYTGQPETRGGLVKTLDFKIYLGLLTETYNPAHQDDLRRTGAVPIDMVVVNLYPFERTVAAAGVTVEQARGNIDIGGPCMIRAAAKNFIRVASVVDPADYPMILDNLNANGGATSLALRLALAKKAFAHTARYDQAIAAYLEPRTLQEADACYPGDGQ
jgi:phosphoribosylaminoimidazolecarboxamide formyltransferase/IMP cyclohydrolase